MASPTSSSSNHFLPSSPEICCTSSPLPRVSVMQPSTPPGRSLAASPVSASSIVLRPEHHLTSLLSDFKPRKRKQLQPKKNRQTRPRKMARALAPQLPRQAVTSLKMTLPTRVEATKDELLEARMTQINYLPSSPTLMVSFLSLDVLATQTDHSV